MFKKLFNWLKKFFNWLFFGNGKNNHSQEPVPLNSTIRIIGDRNSGKTTYITALAHWPNAKADSPVETVEAIGPNGRKLISEAQNLLEQGDMIPPTNFNKIEGVKDYVLQITFKNEFAPQPRLKEKDDLSLTMTIYFKDYAGEFFQNLIEDPNNDLLEDYLDDCIEAEGILLLVDGTSLRKDREFARGMKEFLTRLDYRLEEKKQRRIAMVLNKSEQPELWINRHQPRKIAKARFPKLVEELEHWEHKKLIVVDYFAASAYGMLGRQPNLININRDNSGVSSILEKPKYWRPFGLVAPLYWLCNGERHPRLEID